MTAPLPPPSGLRVALRRRRRAIGALRASGMLGSLRLGGLARFVAALPSAPRNPTIILRLHACNAPDRLALVDGDVRLTYRELDERVNRLAHALASLGVGSGDRVALLVPNGHEQLTCQWAVLRAGATAVQVGTRLKPPEVAHILANSEPKVFVVHARLAETARAARDLAGVPQTDALIETGAPLEALIAGGQPRAALPRRPESKGAVMVYTSGTTGRPKGAARDLGGGVPEAASDFVQRLGIRTDERHLVVCPLYHSAAPAFVGFTFMVGGTVVIQGGSFDPEAVLATIERERITSSFMVPTMLARLAALPEEVRRRHDVSSLRWLMSGAAPLPTETARRVEEAFGPVLYNFYGATETGLVTLAGPGEHTARPGTIGRPLATVELRFLDDEGRDVAPGQVGEVFVRTPMLVNGYHRDPDATSRAMRDGFFSVGDVGRMDEDGYVHLAERKQDMVISGGINIYPREIEDRLLAHPTVLDCAVVGVPDPEWGESLVAFVVVRPGETVDPEAMRAFCRETLADYKAPRRFEVVDEIPRNPTGKVLKRELRARAAPGGVVASGGGR